MITTTLGAIAAAEPALDRLGARPLPIKAAYSTSKFLKLVREELRTYQTLHDDLVKKHGRESEPGSGQFSVPPAHWRAFREDLEQLLGTSIDIPWTPIALDTLGADPMRADDLVALAPFLTDGAAPQTVPMIDPPPKP